MVEEFGHGDIILWLLLLLQELDHQHLVVLVNGDVSLHIVASVQELSDRDVVLSFLEEVVNCLLVQKEGTNSGVQESGSWNAVGLKVLGDGGLVHT